jgi:hypothetical protein
MRKNEKREEKTNKGTEKESKRRRGIIEDSAGE